MKFDETCKVLVDTLSKDEARAFVVFLKTEIARHKMDIDNAVNLIYTVVGKFGLDDMLDIP